MFLTFGEIMLRMAPEGFLRFGQALPGRLEATFGGAGSTFPPMAVSVPLTAARIPLAWFLAVQLGWGLPGVWWAISLTTIAKGAVLAAWWGAGSWREYRT